MHAWLRGAAGTYGPRLISPLLDSMTWRLPPAAGRAVALTFDDGPTPHTGRLLEVLARFDVRATFFLLGRGVERHPREAAAIVNAGHEIANHSWSHLSGWRADMATLVREYRRTDAALQDLTGQPVRWVRPPYGTFTFPLIHWARRRGQRVAMWDTMPCDYSPHSRAAAVAAGIMKARPRSIVCLHDNAHSASVTPEALWLALPRLRDRGDRFVTLSGGIAAAENAAAPPPPVTRSAPPPRR